MSNAYCRIIINEWKVIIISKEIGYLYFESFLRLEFCSKVKLTYVTWIEKVSVNIFWYSIYNLYLCYIYIYIYLISGTVPSDVSDRNRMSL